VAETQGDWSTHWQRGDLECSLLRNARRRRCASFRRSHSKISHIRTVASVKRDTGTAVSTSVTEETPADVSGVSVARCALALKSCVPAAGSYIQT
jgi:hypothetical protein